MNFDIESIQFLKLLKTICDKYNVKLYMVGGAVRDILLNKKPIDFDFLVSDKIDEIALEFSQMTNTKYILFEKKIRVFRYVFDNCVVDLSKFDSNNLDLELKRRDFTINAIAFDLDTKSIIDPTKGIEDLRNRVVKYSNCDVFKDDPIRLIRLFRIAAQLKFDIEKNTLQKAKSLVHLIHNIANDRITQELEKFLLINDTFNYVLLMDRIGLLDELFEELSYENGCMQSSSHLYDVKSHSLNVYNFVEWSILRMKRIVGEECFEYYYDYYKTNRKQIIIALKLAALFHDCAKPFVKQINNDEISFKNHEIYSAEIFKKYAKQYNFQNKITKITVFLILNHIEPAKLFLNWKNNTLTDELLYDFFDKFGINGVDLLIFALADTLAKGKIRMVNREVFIDFLKDMTCFYFQRYLNFLKLPQILKPNEMLELGVENKKLSIVIRLLKKNIFLQKIKTKDEAIAFAKQFL
ncbi:HD domain-containing protein [Desulfurella sp.]|uniref:HD domain-containing protein n=1 Tax=Desulfurella sp. TaxID=1962857 RepID=UPI0025BC3D60|nr:HD domain-containing protein [Desulfurella sp.]